MVRAGRVLEHPSGLFVLVVPLVPVKWDCASSTRCATQPPMDEKKNQRIPIMMSASEVARIDAWRAKQPGIPSRAEAIRRLVEKGLEAG